MNPTSATQACEAHVLDNRQVGHQRPGSEGVAVVLREVCGGGGAYDI